MVGGYDLDENVFFCSSGVFLVMTGEFVYLPKGVF
jgi:hypothetical protein